ncbi:MAG: ribosome maturation factor RimM [Christensenellales bacterium]
MIEIAKVLKPHGIKGDVKLMLYSQNFDDFAARGFAYIKKNGGGRRALYTVLRTAPPFVYAHFEGADTRTDAESLAGEALYIRREDLKAPDEGEYYVADLIGMTVKDEKDAELGVLCDVLQHGAADVYVVKGGKNFMFPALKAVIKSADTKTGVMLVDSGALSKVAVYDDL